MVIVMVTVSVKVKVMFRVMVFRVIESFNFGFMANGYDLSKVF